MNLPNYFLADLPEATLSPAMIHEACQTLKSNRERYLLSRSTQTRIGLLSTVAKSWLDPEYPFRKLALGQHPGPGQFSKVTLARGLDAFFREVTAENLSALLDMELGHQHRLDELSGSELEHKLRRESIAVAPELIAHVTAGNVPAAGLFSLLTGVLLRSAQFLKCASGHSLLPRLFAHSLYEAEPKLGACIEVAEWPGGDMQLENILFEEADCVTASGRDETLVTIRQRVTGRTRFVGYGHRVSFAYVTGEVLDGINLGKTIEQAADDVVAWNQLGCLSPHVIYVENANVAESFAEMLARELEIRETNDPRGEVSVEVSAAIRSRRSVYEVRAAASRVVRSPDDPVTRLWNSKESTAWTVVYESIPLFQLSCLNRFVYVKPVANLTDALHNAESVRGKVSTVGLAAQGHRAKELATVLARWGVSRICPLGQMQKPPLTWHHDGRSVLGDLITWSDWEK
jgi:hypothetical protein